MILKKSSVLTTAMLATALLAACSKSDSGSSIKDSPIPEKLTFDASQVSKQHLSADERATGLELARSIKTFGLANGNKDINSTADMSAEEMNIKNQIQIYCNSSSSVATPSSDSSPAAGKTYPISGLITIDGSNCPIKNSSKVSGSLAILQMNQSSRDAALYADVSVGLDLSVVSAEAQKALLTSGSTGNMHLQTKIELHQERIDLLLNMDGSLTSTILPSAKSSISGPVTSSLNAKAVAHGSNQHEMNLQTLISMNISYQNKNYPFTIYMEGAASTSTPQVRAFLGDSELSADEIKSIGELPTIGSSHLGLGLPK